jgi:hypothetical protein
VLITATSSTEAILLFSDHIIFVDESGDHSLKSIDSHYPIFALAFCIIRKDDYIHRLVPAVQEFKFRWFGHDCAILHEHEIRRAEAPFVFLGNKDKKWRFMTELTKIIEECPMVVVASVIRKDELSRRYTEPKSPYELALLFCMERAREYLHDIAEDTGGLTHIVCEARGGSGGKEDRELELEFRRITTGANPLSRGPIEGFEILFTDKKANSVGLQIADLVARPIGLKTLRPDQENRAYETILPKVWDRKVLPQKSERPR